MMFIKKNFRLIFVLITLIFQVLFALKTNDIVPTLTLTSQVPNKNIVRSISLGDEEFYFRFYGYQLQMMGDTFGRKTPLNKYNYQELYKWFLFFDQLDYYSNYIPAIASYYYAMTPDPKQLRIVLRYLEKHSYYDVNKKWWWLSQAVYHYLYRLNDNQKALELAYLMSIAEEAPLWAKQMPAFVHEKLGEKDYALLVIKNILDNADNLTDNEKNFMNHFINERLEKLAPKSDNNK